jgi:branched-chain amino acid aminotransferase
MSYTFPVTRNPNPKPKPSANELVFGKQFTDHMFVMDYDEGQGWHDGKVVLTRYLISGFECTALWQMMFEGMKAYKTEDGRVLLFRPEMNARRLNRTNERICMPQMGRRLFVAAVKATVHEDKTGCRWPGTSLYIRRSSLRTMPRWA